ncbi:hypothetical protein PV367_02110 [Streptomyces europaeiscabiei]|uniref:Uncharacterized protein n=1 Tax=Streptomyces europaeiscabiei TaxID=146819 RepID=A0AAJ2PJU6_9ACTN|nr:hypothetical protein [Streptomyces europaeiscabiei]MDX3128617.1 hypothetical protein [Streptomyces europaeiscabiei]
MTLLVLLHSALTLVRLGGCALLLSKAGPILHRPRLGRALERTTGLALIGFGFVVTAASGRVGRPSHGGINRASPSSDWVRPPRIHLVLTGHGSTSGSTRGSRNHGASAQA